MLLRSIRSRLLGLIIATVVPFIALIGVGLWNQSTSEHAAAIQRSIEEARLIATQVDDHVGNIHNLMVGIAPAISLDPQDVSKNDTLLRKVKAELPPYFANVLVFSLDGTNIGSSASPGGNRPNAKGRPYFENVKAGEQLTFGEVVVGRVLRQWIVRFSRPIFDDVGKLRGVISVGTLLSQFPEFLQARHLPAGSIIRIVNEHGIVVTQTVDGPEWFGVDLSGMKDVARHLEVREASEVVRWPDGVNRITGSVTAKQVPWLISVGLPADVATAAILQRLTLGLTFAVIALLAAFAIAWTVSGRIVRPLRRLGRDAATLAAGKLSHRSPVSSGDEVGRLAESFNRMAAALQQREEDAGRAADDVRQAKETLAAVIDASPVAIVCSDPDRRVFVWSRSAERIFGYTAEEAIGQFARDMPPNVGPEALGLVRRALSGEIIRDLRVKRLRKDGTVVDVRVAVAPMYNLDGSVRGVARAYEDVTDRVRAEAQLNRIAHYDQLTGLPNRLSLQKELGRLLANKGRSTAIAMFDLDGFKDVNDTLGHSTGDELLVEVGQRLVDVTEGRGQVCRLGGDEFVLTVPECGDPLVVGEIVDAMLKRLTEPFNISNHVLHVGGSAGIAIAPADGSTVDELIANADLALYRAKSDGGRGYRFFLPVMRAQAQARRSLDLELRRAYSQNEFELYFQPQVRLADGAVVGAEALLRWRHPVAGILAPGAFIDTLAASAIAPEVSRWIVRTACARTAGWRADGLALGRIAVNLFPCQLADEALMRDLDEALRDTGLPPEVLELEITENVVLDFDDAASLQKIHDRGIKLAFDDFGTGYASLSYLTRFPLARIKIDRSFIGKVTDDTGDAAIVRSLIAMAHHLGLAVIAEGVETTAQAAFLVAEKCEEAQGYLYAKPLPAAEFEAFLRSRPLADASEKIGRRVSRDTKFQRRAGKGRRAPAS